ncbi:ankyrin repeat and SOCS box protein 13-like [Ptychodera flava]|uniref:ankyrin repeat and SOCS box protein 13-like n=1 Tax=Ptychodera flava TaxID=63121 RepID=UPI00396A037D
MHRYFDSWTLADRTAMHHAAANGELLLLQSLIAQDGNVNKSTMDGETPLHEACLQGRYYCARMLINAGSAVNARNIDGATPLCDACVSGSVECVKLLLDHGAEVNPHLLSASPLHEAAMRGNWECMELLIEAGANLEASDCHYGTPLHIACFKQCPKSVDVLLKAGANVNAAKILETPLHRVAKYNNLPMIQRLLEFGADITRKDNKELRPIDYSKGDAKELLHYWQSHPPPLLHMCRHTIRRILSCGKLKHIDQLQLPTLLLNYLKFA